MNRPAEDLQRLRQYLAERAFAQQERLPPERMLAEELALTRSRLRTALKKLHAEGTIWRHVGKGTFFGTRLEAVDIDLKRISRDGANPREVMVARLVLEPLLARMAASEATSGELRALETLHGDMNSTINWSEWDTLDYRLHRAIAHAANNRLLLILFDTVQAHRSAETWWRIREVVEPAPRIRTAVAEHAEIVEAIVARDQERAEAAMRRHLLRVRRDMFEREV